MEEIQILKNEEEQFKSVELAYPIALASFDVMQRRFEAFENRVQTTMTLLTTMTIAVPSFAFSKGQSFHKFWFMTAITCFILAMALAIGARIFGKIKIINPKFIYDFYLSKDAYNFKKDIIYFAGECCDKNLKTLDIKTYFVMASILLVMVEAISLALWVGGF